LHDTTGDNVIATAAAAATQQLFAAKMIQNHISVLDFLFITRRA
jgi:hypothetical protein